MDFCKRKGSLSFNNKRCFFFFFFFFLLALFTLFISTTSICLGFRCPLSSSKSGIYLQDYEKKRDHRVNMEFSSISARRFLSGPGSSPPRCTSKCGSCTPCKPVHVPVPPGTPVTAEYYPEAWRCKCGNKLYMP